MNLIELASASDLIDSGIAVLKQILPSSWQVVRLQDDLSVPTRADAVLHIGPTNQVSRVVMEARKSFSPRDVDGVIGRAQLLSRVGGEVPYLVVAPWLSERSRSLLAEAGLNYVDLAGNIRVATNYPSLFVLKDSKTNAPGRPVSRLSLRGVKAGRLVSLLADVAPPYGVLDLANYSGVTPGYVSRLLEMLDREAIVERTKRGSVERVDWRELLKRRAESYGVFTSNSITRYVSPNGPNYALEKIGDVQWQDVALTGSIPVERIITVAPPSLLILYTRSSEIDLVKVAGLLPADEGANVVLAKPADDVIMEPRWPGNRVLRVPVVAASQLALDCLTGNGRMPQEGAAFMDWMGENEGQWRAKSLAELPPKRAMN